MSQQKKFQLMGILNLTPDSFSDGGRYPTVDDAVEQAIRMEAEGAAWIDVGGESTRPGHTPVSIQEELDRILPVIRRLVKEVKVPVSVDTYKAEVARCAIEEGVSMVNDIWGLKGDPKMAEVVARYKVPVVLMHNRSAEQGAYQSLMADVVDDLQECIRLARNSGVPDDRIILDPGIGFGKNYEQNMEVMRCLDQIVALGYPVLLGTSRKSMIGLTLDLPVDKRLEGTLATSAVGLIKGCQIFRVHDVLEHHRFLTMLSALMNESG